MSLIFAATALHAVRALPAQAPPAPALRIVVVEGEGGVNIIQQKTAVTSIVEVRDRNNQPVAGAVVTFAIRSGGATFNGASTLTVATNAAGRAAVAGLSPTASGALQISASAAFQGQTAAVTITQTNVMTAAQAASAGSAGAGGAGTSGPAAGGTGAGGSAAGGAAGGAAAGTAVGAGAGVGGVSGAMVAGVAAAAGGGAIVAVKAAGGGTNGGSSGGSSGDGSGAGSAGGGVGGSGGAGGTSPGGNGSAGNATTYSGPVSGQWQVATTTASANQSNTCVSTRAIDGTLAITLDRRSDAIASGTARVTGTESEISVTASPFCTAQGGAGSVNLNVAITGTVSAIGFNFTSSSSGPTPNGGGSVTCSETTTFSGALAGGVVSGNITRSRTCQGSNVFNGVSSTINGNGLGTFAVTLR